LYIKGFGVATPQLGGSMDNTRTYEGDLIESLVEVVKTAEQAAQKIEPDSNSNITKENDYAKKP
jgi:hypothetical protein